MLNLITYLMWCLLELFIIILHFYLKLISNLWSNQEYTYLPNSYGDSWVHWSLNHCFRWNDVNESPQRPYLPPKYWLTPGLVCLLSPFASHSTSKYPLPLAWPQIPSMRDIRRPNGATAFYLRGLALFTTQSLALWWRALEKGQGIFVY